MEPALSTGTFSLREGQLKLRLRYVGTDPAQSYKEGTASLCKARLMNGDFIVPHRKDRKTSSPLPHPK